MTKYIVTYNGSQNLFYDYQVIEGKDAKDALKRAFGKVFHRLTGDAGRYATIILVKGEMRGNTQVIKGKYTMLCYEEAN